MPLPPGLCESGTASEHGSVPAHAGEKRRLKTPASEPGRRCLHQAGGAWSLVPPAPCPAPRPALTQGEDLPEQHPEGPHIALRGVHLVEDALGRHPLQGQPSLQEAEGVSPQGGGEGGAAPQAATSRPWSLSALWGQPCVCQPAPAPRPAPLHTPQVRAPPEDISAAAWVHVAPLGPPLTQELFTLLCSALSPSSGGTRYPQAFLPTSSLTWPWPGSPEPLTLPPVAPQVRPPYLSH